jgi:hypothetical protein
MSSFVSHIRNWHAPHERSLKEALRIAAKSIHKETRWLCSTIPWRFIVVDDRLESGMPHTIHSAIVFPLRWLEMLTTSIEHSRTERIWACVETLVHERVHVWQKMHPPLFHSLYVTWGWKFMSSVPKSLTELHRHNPDTPYHWCIQEERSVGVTPTDTYIWVPCVRFRTSPQSLHDVDYFLVRFNENNHVFEWHSMRQVQWYQTFHNNVPHCYHPDEASAVLLAKLACKGLDMHTISNAEKAMMAWLFSEVKPAIPTYS